MSSNVVVQQILRRGLQHRQPCLWFAPRQHLWLQCSIDTYIPTTSFQQQNEQQDHAAAAAPTWRVRWGMTEQGMDRLGDIVQLQSLVALPSDSTISTNAAVIVQGQDLLKVHWEGYEWTEADELYHTVWESIEGVETVQAPVTGKFLHVATKSTHDETVIIDEDSVWVEQECRQEDLVRAAASWTDETAYLKWVETLSPGRFAA